MKHGNRMFRRCLAMLLAVGMVVTGSGFNGMGHVYAEEGTKVSLHELIVKNYGGELSDAEKEIITSGVLKADQIFTYVTPTANDNLILVDEDEKVVTAKAFTDTENDHTWIPLSFDLKDGDKVIEGHDDIALTGNGEEYTGNYTTEANHFSVEVTYVLKIEVDEAVQREILEAGKHLNDDISDMKYLKEVSIFPEDSDTYDALETQIQTMIKQMLASQGVNVPEGDIAITSDLVLMYLTMDALELDGKKTSAVEQIYSLINEETVILPNGDEYEIGFTKRDAKDAVERLYLQKETGLSLHNNISANVANTYLEWLMTDTENLKSALSGNYGDLNYLANNKWGLQYVSGQLELLLEEIAYYIVEEAAAQGYTQIDSIEAFEAELANLQAERDAKLQTLNEALGKYNYGKTVTNSEELAEAIAWLKEQRTSLFEEVLGENLTTLNDTLASYGYDKTITAANYTADMEAAIQWLQSEKENLFASAVSGELAKLNNALAKVGYTGTVTAANYAADIDAAKAYANAEDGMPAYFCNQINTRLENTMNGQQIAGLQFAGMYPVESKQDMENLREAIATLRQMGQMSEEDYAKADAALSTALTALNDTSSTLDTAKSALKDAKMQFDAAFEEKLGQLQEAQSAEAKFNTEFDNKITELKTAQEALNLVESLESAKAQLDAAEQKKQMLDMLITIMQLLCNNLKVVNDNFEGNSWNALKLLDSEKAINYTALTALVETQTENPDVDVVKQLSVDEVQVVYNLSMYNVTLQIQAVQVDPTKADSKATIELPYYEATDLITLRKGSTTEEIQAAIDVHLESIKTEAKKLSGWQAANVGEENYICSVETVLPEQLSEDITYIVKYSPKIFTLTFDGFTVNGNTQMSVPYGYRFTLPSHEDDTKEYRYTFGTETNIMQGKDRKVTKDTTITRKEGARSSVQNLNTLAAETILKDNSAILLNDAVDKFGEVYITLPGEKQVSVEYAPSSTGMLIKAISLASGVSELEWKAAKGYLLFDDGTKEYFQLDANGEFVTEKNFQYAYVVFELPLSADGLGVDGAELLKVINIPYTLKTDYDNQKNALEGLYTTLPYLKRLNNDPDQAITVGVQTYTIKGLLAALPSIGSTLGLSQNACVAAAQLSGLIPNEGQLTLCTLLEEYYNAGIESDGTRNFSKSMLYYYRNEAAFLKEINHLYGVLEQLVGDESLMALLDQYGYADMFIGSTAALETAHKLNVDYAIDKDLINIDSDALPALLTKLEMATVKKYDTVPADMIWIREVKRAPLGLLNITLNVMFQGASATPQSWTVEPNTEVSAEEINCRIETMLSEVGMTDEIEKHYTRVISDYDATIKADTTINVTWTPKNYEVVVPGMASMTVTINGGNLGALAKHEDSDWAYTYYVGTTPIFQGADLILSSKNVAELVDDNGVITITRTAANMAEENLINTANNLGVVLSKNGEGEYIMVLPMNGTSSATVKDSLVNFMMGQITSQTTMGGEAFFDGKFHLQTMIDVLMDSGLSTESIKAMTDDGGNLVNDLTVQKSSILGTVSGKEITDPEGQPTGQVALGATLVKTSLGIGSAADGSYREYPFYITITESSALLEGLVTKLESYGVTIALEDGVANLDVDLKDDYYGMYAAALTVMGEADLKNINAINGTVAFGYLLDLLEPVYSDTDVDMDTIENTLGKFGMHAELSDYQGIYGRIAAYLKENEVEYTENGCKLPIKDLSINGLVDSLSEGITLPEALAGASLGSMIYEYQEEGETDGQYGIDLNISAGLTNIDKTYVAMAVDATNRKLYMVTADDLDAIADAQYVVLLDNIGTQEAPVALNLSAKVLDLNGKTIVGSVTGSGLRIVDNVYTADAPGKVVGDVNVAAVLGGAYDKDVTAMLPDGYTQTDGVVSNILYTITRDEETNETTVALNPTTAAAGLANRKAAENLALELAVDILMNYYNTAALTVNGNKNAIFDIGLENVANTIASGNLLHSILSQGLDCVSAPAMADFVNDIVAALTDFETINEELADSMRTGEPAVICSFDIVTSPLALKVEPASDGDYLNITLQSSENTEAGTLIFVIDGDRTKQDKTEDLMILTGALAETTTVNSKLTLGDIKLNGQNIEVTGSYDGSVVVDFSKDPEYVIMMAVILAKGNTDIRAELVEGVKEYAVIAEDGTITYENPKKLKAAFDKLTIGAIDKALGNISRTERFSDMVKDLALTDYVSKEFAADNSAKGFDLVVDVLGYIMRQVSMENNTRALGSKEINGEYGIYRLEYARTFDGIRALKRGYNLDYDFTVGSASKLQVTLKLFSEQCIPEVSDPAILEGDQADDHLYGWVAKKVEDVPHANTVPGIENIDGILILDKVCEGVTIEELEKILVATVKNDADGKPEFHFYVGGNEIKDVKQRVVNGAVLDVVAENQAGIQVSVSWLIIVTGDTNGNGRIESGDSVKMSRHFQNIEMMTSVALIAADTNYNGRVESGDAVKNTIKYQNADNYISSLQYKE